LGRTRAVGVPGLGLPGLGLVLLTPLQVRRRGLVSLLALRELRSLLRREPAAQPPAQGAVAELLHVSGGEELGRGHAFGPAGGVLCLCLPVSLSAGRPRKRRRRARTLAGARPGPATAPPPGDALPARGD